MYNRISYKGEDQRDPIVSVKLDFISEMLREYGRVCVNAERVRQRARSAEKDVVELRYELESERELTAKLRRNTEFAIMAEEILRSELDYSDAQIAGIYDAADKKAAKATEEKGE